MLQPHVPTPLRIFSWGYWGWGNWTRELNDAVTDVEASRGFAAPLFADVRISRLVRARGFQGDALAGVVGAERHVHLPGLGNARVAEGHSIGIRIARPEDAALLMDLALRGADAGRRVLFFCSCEFPGPAGHDDSCHRSEVARLLLGEASRLGLALEVVEWPGEPPSIVEGEVPVSHAVVRRLREAGKALPTLTLAKERPALPWLCLGWGSVLMVRTLDGSLTPLIVGPARCGAAGWFVNLLARPLPPGTSLAAAAAIGQQLAAAQGFGLRSSTDPGLPPVATASTYALAPSHQAAVRMPRPTPLPPTSALEDDASMNDDVRVFDQGDGPYQHWMAQHPKPRGLVAHTGRSATCSDFRLHYAGCGHIASYSEGVEMSFTAGASIKVCSESLPALMAWFREHRPNAPAEPRRCGHCQPPFEA